MELGSPEHKRLLMQGIIKVALKTISLGFVLGLILMIPFLFRENAFSTGIAYLGLAILIGSLVYSVTLALRKYKRIIKNFDETYNSKE